MKSVFGQSMYDHYGLHLFSGGVYSLDHVEIVDHRHIRKSTSGSFLTAHSTSSRPLPHRTYTRATRATYESTLACIESQKVDAGTRTFLQDGVIVIQ